MCFYLGCLQSVIEGALFGCLSFVSVDASSLFTWVCTLWSACAPDVSCRFMIIGLYGYTYIRTYMVDLCSPDYVPNLINQPFPPFS